MSREQPPASWSSRVLRVVETIEDGLLIILLTGMILLAASQIVIRNLFGGGLLWADPSLRVMVLWVGLIGAMVATRYDKQISVDVVSRFLPEWGKAAVRVITDVFTFGVSTAVAWSAWRLVLDDRAAGITLFASVPLWVCELILPLAFAVIAARYLVYAARHLKAVVRARSE